MKRIDVPASSLNKCESLSLLSPPIGIYSFLPERGLLSQLMADVLSPIEFSDAAIPVIRQMHYMNTPHSYQVVKEPEAAFSRVNLDIIMHHIQSSLPERLKSLIKYVQDEGVSNNIQYTFSFSKSSPHPSIMYRYNEHHFGLIASEAKGFDASMMVGYAQAVALASDFAVDLHYRCDVDSQDIVVPFVLASASRVQFGAVYLVEDCFPVPVLLSDELSVTSTKTLTLIMKWILALSRFIEHAVDTYIPSQRAHQEPRYKNVDPVARLNLSKYFFKPIREMDCRNILTWLTGLMDRFQRLWDSEDSRQYVVFPVGCIGVPDIETQKELHKSIRARVKHLFIKYKEQQGEYDTKYSTPGAAIVLYQEYDMNVWKRGDAILSDPNADARVRLAFLDQLSQATEAFEKAGVIHTDLRLFNIFYKLERRDSHCSSHATDQQSSAVLAMADSSSFTLEVRVLDWDDSVNIGNPLPEYLISERVGHTGPDPVRYVYPSETGRVTAEYHTFFLGQIRHTFSLCK